MRTLFFTAIVCIAIYSVSGMVKNSVSTIQDHNNQIEKALNGDFR